MATKGITTPKGTFQYPKFFKPDFKYDEDGTYSGPITISLDDPKAQEIRAALESALAEHVAALKKDAEKKGKSPKIKVCEDLPWSVDTDANTLTIKAKKSGQYKDKKTGDLVKMKVAVFGPDNTLMEDPGYLLGSGTTGRVTFGIHPFPKIGEPIGKMGAGITLRLLGVQILEMKEYQRSGASLGFDAVEMAEEAAGAEEFSAPETATGQKDF